MTSTGIYIWRASRSFSSFPPRSFPPPRYFPRAFPSRPCPSSVLSLLCLPVMTPHRHYRRRRRRSAICGARGYKNYSTRIVHKPASQTAVLVVLAVRIFYVCAPTYISPCSADRTTDVPAGRQWLHTYYILILYLDGWADVTAAVYRSVV